MMMMMMLVLMLVPLWQPGGAGAQSLFGPITPSGPASECPLAAYERRAGEVQEVCCSDGCPDGLPAECNLDCAVICALRLSVQGRGG